MYLFNLEVYIQNLNKGTKGRTKGNIAHMCVHNSIRMQLELWAILKIDILPNHCVGSETPLHRFRLLLGSKNAQEAKSRRPHSSVVEHVISVSEKRILYKFIRLIRAGINILDIASSFFYLKDLPVLKSKQHFLHPFGTSSPPSLSFPTWLFYLPYHS